MSLTPRQQRFILEYLADPARNGKQAAIRAGYSPQGQCPNVQASKLLADPEVQAEIARQLRGYCQKLEVDAQMVVQGILDSIEACKKSGIAHGRCRASSAAMSSWAATWACFTTSWTSMPTTS